MERSDTHHGLSDGDGFRETLNPSSDLAPDELFDLPDGQISDFPVQPLSAKIFRFSPDPTQIYIPRRPVPLRGAARDVTDAGRDAMDADARLTGEAEADGEVVWS